MVIIFCFPNQNNCTAQIASQNLNEAFPSTSAWGFKHFTSPHMHYCQLQRWFCAADLFSGATGLLQYSYAVKKGSRQKRKVHIWTYRKGFPICPPIPFWVVPQVGYQAGRNYRLQIILLCWTICYDCSAPDFWSGSFLATLDDNLIMISKWALWGLCTMKNDVYIIYI